jgi:hypothetical protein
LSENLGGGAFRDFTLVEDPDEARGYLSEGSRLSSTVMLWTSGQSHVIKGAFGRYDRADRSFFVTLPKKFKLDGFLNDHRRGSFQECLFNVGLVSAHVFFKAKFIKVDDGGLKFYVPEAIYKVQRRKSLRYCFPTKERLMLEIGDRKRPLLDVSAGGLCFFATDQEAKFYTAGSVINGCSFKLGDRMIKFDAEIRHAVQTCQLDEKTIGKRVGVQFRKLSAADDQYLAWFVLEETRKLLSKVL